MDDYKPPQSKEELLHRYSLGERHFPGTDLDGVDFSRVTLDGASFGRFSWFFDASFDGASLRGTSFRECNVKCASFRDADLTGASFELAAIESIEPGTVSLMPKGYDTILSPQELADLVAFLARAK